MIAVAAPLPPIGFATRLALNLRLWREKRRWIAEMRHAAGLGRLNDILSDVGLSRGDLDTLIDAPVDAGHQFETYATMAQVNLRDLDPAKLREAEWACIRCPHADPCRRWLREGVWDNADDPRCPNAAFMKR